jgi:hypothetical protein
MWDEKDYTARWVQGFCAIFLALFAAVDGYLVVTSFGLFYGIAGITLFFSSIYYCWRCLRYAVTGKGNVNRDGF